jgi:glycosyltransferase involved in cell wall biosynthesis
MITVVLPIFNGAAYLKDALASILAQEVEFELIISDDGSTDHSLAIVDSFDDPRICVLRNSDNAGIFGNLNRCIQAARGDVVQVFSQDDVMMPGYLASQAAALARHDDAGLVYGCPLYIDSEGASLGEFSEDRTPERIEWPLYLWISSHYGSVAASISSIMIRRDVFRAIGLFDPAFPMAGDLEFYNRLAERYVILRNASVLHKVRSHPKMASAQRSAGESYLREELRLAQWQQRRWSQGEWAKICEFRADLRGRYHLAWIVRAALRGRIGAAARGLRDANKIYPLRAMAYWLLRRRFVSHERPFPFVAPPAEHPAP